MNVITVTRTRKQTPPKTPSTLRSFRELTRSYFAGEGVWQFAIETLLFAVMAAISAWPICGTAALLNQFLRHLPN
jgi:hypothetical protein